MRRFIAHPVLVALALALGIMVLGGGVPAAAVEIDFEVVPGLTGMGDFLDGQIIVPTGARLSDQLQLSKGVSFTSTAGYVALVTLGSGHATSGVNGIGGATADNILKYNSPIVIRFTVPGDPNTPAITDFVSIKVDNFPATIPGTVTMEAFDVNGAALGSAQGTDAVGLVLSLPFANIHSIRLTQTRSDIAFDDLRFNPLRSHLGDAPVAKVAPVGPIYAGQTVTLDGSGSADDDTDTDKLVFAWTLMNKPPQSSATLSAAETMAPSFVADVLGDYTVRLIVTDARGLKSAPADVTISPLNALPVADAGPDQGAFVGTAVSLNGSRSSDDQDGLTFFWALAVPPGSAAQISGETTAYPTFTPDVPGEYAATLTVKDRFNAESTDGVVVSAVTGGNFAEEQVVLALNAISKLTRAQVTTRGNQNAMQQHLTQVIAALQVGDKAQAADKLFKTIERTDGCALRSAPDGDGEGRDWLIECGAQAQVYSLLMAALHALMP